MSADPGRLDWSREAADWPHREVSRFIRAGGLQWHVQDFPCASGDPAAPVVLLLHGTGAATHSWRALAPLLARGARVIAPDLPGHGFTDPAPSGGASPGGMAMRVQALLAAISVQPARLIGHSAGGAIALRMALDGRLDPAATSAGLVALNGALLPLHGLAWSWFSPAAKLLAAAPVVPHLVAWRAQGSALVDRLLDGTGSQADETGRRLYARLVGSPAHVAGALQMMANWDLEALRRDLPRLHPGFALHLVVGERDRTVPPHQAWQVQALLPRTTVMSLPGLGHLAHEESAERVMQALQASKPATG